MTVVLVCFFLFFFVFLVCRAVCPCVILGFWAASVGLTFGLLVFAVIVLPGSRCVIVVPIVVCDGGPVLFGGIGRWHSGVHGQSGASCHLVCHLHGGVFFGVLLVCGPGRALPF